MTTHKASQAATESSITLSGAVPYAGPRVTAEAVLPVYASLLPQAKLREWLAHGPRRLYWRSLSPLIVLWGMLYQRLQADHSCDAALTYLRSGAADGLDPADRHAQALSQRLRSESTAGYVQGRNRLPLTLIQAALQWVAAQVAAWLQVPGAAAQGAQGLWHGRTVRVLDGTTFRLRPYGDLAATYGQAHNQQGPSYWVVAKSLVSFCLQTQVCVGYAEGWQQVSEPGLFRAVVAQETQPHCLYIADQGLGVYRIAQVAQHYGHEVVLRLEARTAKRLRRLAGGPSLHSGQECCLAWRPAPGAVCEPDLPPAALAGRLLYLHLAPPGFRPFDVYLFTTLCDAGAYPLAEVCALYAQRWRSELYYRHLKTVMEMEAFAVHSAALFRKELAVGLLAYNLVCALMTQAALQAGIAPCALSFSRCLRRISSVLSHGVPAWVWRQSDPLTYLLQRLATCRLPQQPSKCRHEPRQVRRKQGTYPPLFGDRQLARQQWLKAST